MNPRLRWGWLIVWAVLGFIVGIPVMVVAGAIWRLFLFTAFGITVPADFGAGYIELIVYLPLSGFLGATTGAVLAGMLYRVRTKLLSRRKRFSGIYLVVGAIGSAAIGGFLTTILYLIIYRFIYSIGAFFLLLYILLGGLVGGSVSAIASIRIARFLDNLPKS
jgi:hypothetical protein